MTYRIEFKVILLIGKTLGGIAATKKRIFSGVPPPSKGGTGKYSKDDFCKKSNNTMG